MIELEGLQDRCHACDAVDSKSKIRANWYLVRVLTSNMVCAVCLDSRRPQGRDHPQPELIGRAQLPWELCGCHSCA